MKIDINNMLLKYIPIQLFKKNMSREKENNCKCLEKEFVIFFSDIKNFTEITETIGLKNIGIFFNEYLSEMYDIAKKFGGIVSNTSGDEIFILFECSQQYLLKKNSIRCVKMAIAMQKKIIDIKKRWLKKGLIEPLQIRCGINTGLANIGSFGSNNYKIYTAIGSQVNLASRLENESQPGGILISQSTWLMVKNYFNCRPRKKFYVKGFSRPVIAYDIIF